jgi:hypothetical protein
VEVARRPARYFLGSAAGLGPFGEADVVRPVSVIAGLRGANGSIVCSSMLPLSCREAKDQGPPAHEINAVLAEVSDGGRLPSLFPSTSL